MKPAIVLITPVLLLITLKTVTGQGCSDAGVCSISHVKPDAESDTISNNRQQLKSGISYGIAQYNVSVLTLFTEYSRYLGKKTSVAIKISAGMRSGELAATIGLSDAIFTINQNILKRMTLTAGMKFPFSYAKSEKGGFNLPMAYQTSLGTYDLIFAGSYIFTPITLAVAWQQPVKQNDNTFLATDSEANAPEQKYQSTHNFQRQGDLVLRISNSHKLNNGRIMLLYSILPILHLGNDSFTGDDGQSQMIHGSSGLTLNLNAILRYNFSKSGFLEISTGAPVISRESRPDGLSQFAITTEYVYNF